MNETVRRRLVAEHERVNAGLSRGLDLGTGLRAAMLPARYADLADDLGTVLDLEAGLAAITGERGALTGIVAVIAAALDAPLAARLATRADLGEVMKLLDEVNTAWALTVAEGGLPAGVAEDLHHAVERAAALSLVVAEVFRRQGADLAAASADWLADVVARAARLAAGLAGAGAGEIARVTAAWPLHLAGAGVGFEGHLLATVAEGLDDFTDTDLAAAGLGDVPLTGIRWSSRTRWPAHWPERVEAMSVRLGEDLFEIRAGTQSRVAT
ncbi:hypothetical protein AB0I28_05520 [Phytomonospora sp. NPDC050363]|uniref:hypothetical protein n=1 Tax=Phytomonospora sp. NPDC050363 TaxID=3155642 RepID=UPI003408BCE4